MTFGKKVLQFLQSLEPQVDLPEGICMLNPFKEAQALKSCQQFYEKFYGDAGPRSMIIGINPGRFGGGTTGIPFTDPVRLATVCGIQNDWPKKQELSSVFIYKMISAFGGPSEFYRNFYITSISPLGFTRGNKNLNYYDDKALEKNLESFVIDCMEQQLNFGIDRNRVFCLGEGKNLKYLTALNEKMKWFDAVVGLPHPRFIMQYRLKFLDEYVGRYLQTLSNL